MVVRRELTSREENARQNLKRIYQARKHQDRITQKDVNKWMGWSNSVFGQYITGRLPLGHKNIIKLAEYFKVFPEDIDPQVANEFIVKHDAIDIITEAALLEDHDKERLTFHLSKHLSRPKKWELLQELLQQFDPQITQSKN